MFARARAFGPGRSGPARCSAGYPPRDARSRRYTPAATQVAVVTGHNLTGCDARLPIADRYDLPVIVYCQEGYTSSLAAAALQDLGLHRATDLAGGIAAWLAAGLPTVPNPPQS